MKASPGLCHTRSWGGECLAIYQTFTWNLRVRGRVAVPEFDLEKSTLTATAELSFAPQVEAFPRDLTYARSPIPTHTSAMVDFGIMAEPGPTVMSSLDMLVMATAGSAVLGDGLAKGEDHPSTSITWMLLKTAAFPVGSVFWMSLVVSCVSTNLSSCAYV